ncbi:hypothetical protein [Azonexus hydrophilus]|uniref:hypothetical protein n=1 Tax=Azonexus hydrophilus TaxID=418702 RepID=UPI0012F92603|nr:hypothetical protein [Azonexus hydrophilus]
MVLALQNFAVVVDLRDLAASLFLIPTVEREMLNDNAITRPYPEKVLAYRPSEHKNLNRSKLYEEYMQSFRETQRIHLPVSPQCGKNLLFSDPPAT